LEAAGRLGGSFFFKRGHSSRGNAKRLFATIAYQLALLRYSTHPLLSRTIAQKVQENPSILHRSLDGQLRQLIIEPCRRTLSSDTLVIVVDGLDESDGQHIQQDILRSIGKSILGQTLPLRFLFVSRPEPHIGEIFRSPCLDSVHRSFNIQSADDDVRRYLMDEFARIHRQHHDTMATVPTPWPSSEITQKLVQKSSGYFIYASTVIKFIDDKNSRPTDGLKIIIGLAEVEPDFGSPFAALDQLYTQILASVPRRRQLLQILTVMFAQFDLKINHIEWLFGLKPGDVRLTLRGLCSLIEITAVGELTAYHASLLDFLEDHTRSGSFYIGSDSQRRTYLAGLILKAFSSIKFDQQKFVCKTLGVTTSFQYIASTKPSPDLVPLIQLFNPDCLFSRALHRYTLTSLTSAVDLISHWLKVYITSLLMNPFSTTFRNFVLCRET
jgi:hypothetical protein